MHVNNSFKRAAVVGCAFGETHLAIEAVGGSHGLRRGIEEDEGFTCRPGALDDSLDESSSQA